MRNSFVAVAAAVAIVSAGSMIPTRADAVDFSVGVRSAVGAIAVPQPISYACRRVWRCGPYGCGLRSVCWWRPGPAYYGHAYNLARPWAYRAHWNHTPYWGVRPHWRWGW
jgi:hypothetical protein